MVKMMVPTMVRQAAEKARLQELTLEAIFGKIKLWPKLNSNSQPTVEMTSKGISTRVMFGPPKINTYVAKGATIE